MKTPFKLSLTVMAALLWIPALAVAQAPAASSTSEAMAEAEDSRPLIVKVHADW